MSPPLLHINVEVLVNTPDRQYGAFEVSPGPGVGGYSLEFLVGVCRPHLQIQTQF